MNVETQNSIEMESLDPKTAQLLNLIDLSNEERATIYSVLQADLVLEDQLMRNTSQLQVLTFNPYYFFGGSRIVKAWLDATATAMLYDVRAQHTSQHAKKEFHYRTQKGSSLASPDTESKKVSLQTSSQINERAKYNTLPWPGAQHKTFSSAVDKPEHKTMSIATSKKTAPVKSSRQIQEHPARSSEHPEKDLSDSGDKSDKARLEGRSVVFQEDPSDLVIAYRMLDTEDQDVSSTVQVSEWTPHHQETQQEEQEDTEVTVWAEIDEPAAHAVGGIQVIPYNPHGSIADLTGKTTPDDKTGDRHNVEEFRMSSESLSPAPSDLEADQEYGLLKKPDFRGSTHSLPSQSSPDVLSPPQEERRASSSAVTPSRAIVRNPSKYRLMHKYHQDQISLVGISRPQKGNYEISGAISVRLRYEEGNLTVTIVEARNLAATDKKGHSNPYVKLHLLPNLKTTKRKTKVSKKTLNPFFNQTFKYPLAKDDLGSRAVWITVWSKNNWQTVFLGETCISLATVDLMKTSFRRWLRLWDYSDISTDTSHPSLASTSNPDPKSKKTLSLTPSISVEVCTPENLV